METIFDQVRSEWYGSTCLYSYKVTDFVGRGRFGTVYETTMHGRSSSLGGRSMAVKVFHLPKDKKPLNSLENWTEWRTGMKALLDLDHKNLVIFHKVTIHKARGAVCVELLMEYCRGGDLAEFLKRLAGRKSLLNERRAVRFVSDVAEGLNYLHEKYIIHGNVLIKHVRSGEDSLAVCDLDDFIQMQGNQTCAEDFSHLRGTYRYMSPEMLKTFGNPPAEERPGRKTDVWSLGCIILALSERVVDINERWLQKGQTTIPAGDEISDEASTINVVDGFIPLCHNSIPQQLRLCIQRCLCERSADRCTALEIVTELKATAIDIGPATDPFAQQDASAEATSAPFRLADGGKKVINAVAQSSARFQSASVVAINVTFGNSCRYQFGPEDYTGRGSVGDVFAGKITQRGDYQGKSRVAIKVVHMEMSQVSFDSEGWKQHCRWWKQLCGLKHNHLLACHKITATEVRTGAMVELVMEYYSGGTLASMLEERKNTGDWLYEEEAIKFATQIAEGLEFLHRNNIIHARLSPQKILLKRLKNGQQRLAIGSLDNVVRMQLPDTCSHDAQHLSYSGTVRYLSPEMIRKFGGICGNVLVLVGRKTDIWSLGCIILQLANAVVGTDKVWLRKGETIIETGHHISNGQYALYILDGFVPLAADYAPHSLADCVLQCLNSSSSERVSAAGLLQKLQKLAPIL